jgi:hypothetical protein
MTKRTPAESKKLPSTAPELRSEKPGANGTCFWGLGFEFQLSGRKRYGHVATLEEAKAAFKRSISHGRGATPCKSRLTNSK